MNDASKKLDRHRKGMLLLLVLLLLSLFMSAGAMLLTLAGRARAAARASAASSKPLNAGEDLARAALDQALMALLRGAPGAATSGSVLVTGPLHENLLADKYGQSVTLSGSMLSGTNLPVLSLQVSPPGPLATNQLHGQILTIAPKPGEGDIVSFRILNTATVSSGTVTCYVAQLPSRVVRALPKPAASFDVIINGREFTPGAGGTPETYDAFDDANMWLARPRVDAGQIDSFQRMSFLGSTASLAVNSAAVDNDNDGVVDGVWFSKTSTPPNGLQGEVISPISRPSGAISFDVSYLVLDLDGRININAAGMAARPAAQYRVTLPAPAPLPSGPLGLGYGPADIDASLVFPAALPSPSGTSAFTGSGTAAVNAPWETLLVKSTTTGTAGPTAVQRRPPPGIGFAHGRYGANERPGLIGDDVDAQQISSEANYRWSVAGPNARGDLRGHIKAFMRPPSIPNCVTPELVFFLPEVVDDFIDDPYEARLDVDASRFATPRRPTAAPAGNDDSPFGLAELERILRPNDVDAGELPPRLAAALGPLAQRSRFMITTDSWSTPAITGAAATQLENYLKDPAKLPRHTPALWKTGSTCLSPDVAAGLRFDVNRPVLTGTSTAAVAQQQEFCKGLYTLALALGETSIEKAAQWAVNVLDFRDEDSVMTRFVYDRNLADGWNPNGPDQAVVWGAERPEIVFSEIAAWRDETAATPTSQVFLGLHRPATVAIVATATSGSMTIARRIEQSTLANAAGEIVLSSTTPSGKPIWRIELTPALGGSGTVWFNKLSGTLPPGVMTPTTSGSIGISGTDTTKNYVFVVPSSPQNYTTSGGFPTVSIDTGGQLGFSPSSGSGTARLQRLANPSLEYDAASNPYLTVDTASITSIPLKNPPPAPGFTPPLAKRSRKLPSDGGTFWKQDWTPGLTTLTTLPVSPPNLASWFHWPNRPLISQAELTLIPATDADGLLRDFAFPTPSETLASGTTPVGVALLEATYVPSRFAANNVTVSGTSIAAAGLDRLPFGQFSKWRQPGLVNVNTIGSGAKPEDSVLWAALLGDPDVELQERTISGTINPFTQLRSGTVQPAASVVQLLTLSGSSNQPVATRKFASPTDARNNNPLFSIDIPVRLANTATIRSEVFAVWITVKMTDSSPNAGSPITKRLFAIIDRSIPVGYSPGRDLNVADTIRLKRFID